MCTAELLLNFNELPPHTMLNWNGPLNNTAPVELRNVLPSYIEARPISRANG